MSGIAKRWTIEDFRSADPAMIRCLQLARLAARTDLPVLILGESGTGKTLLARAVHDTSRRASAPFVGFNAAALSETLVDSQLFGHERGAFTGAQRTVKGKFEIADGGTLFIDEVADMSSAVQAKVLRAIEFGEFERLGSEALRRVDVRLISATNLNTNVALRRDLYHRLCGFTLRLPPLRERRSDLRYILEASIRETSHRHGKSITGIDQRAVELILSYPWPGNLRELDRVVEVAVSLTEGDTIGADAIILDGEAPTYAPAAEPGTPRDLRLRVIIRRHVESVLVSVGGNKRKAARLLGISRTTLDRNLRATAPAADR